MRKNSIIMSHMNKERNQIVWLVFIKKGEYSLAVTTGERPWLGYPSHVSKGKHYQLYSSWHKATVAFEQLKVLNEQGVILC